MESIRPQGRYMTTGTGIVLVLGLALATPAAAHQFHQDRCDGDSRGSGVPAGWVVLRGHIPPAIKNAHPLHPTNPAQPMHLALSFQLRHQAQLEQLLREQNNPTSPNYHHYLAPDEFQQRFGPTPQMLAQGEEFLTAQHLQVTGASGQLIHFTGTVRQVECAFAIQINDYQLGNRVVFAPASDPAVPASLAPMIQAIIGLNNIAIPHPLNTRPER